MCLWTNRVGSRPTAASRGSSILAPLIVFLLCSAIRAHAQCDGCAPDPGCTADPAYPTLCPAQPPNATAGEPYEATITFWLPDNFTDPGTGFNVDFLLMTITSVTGLPYGLDITYSESQGIYHPQDDPYGCARICGTPIGPGTYSITISIVAQVDYNGFVLNVPQQFPLTLVVEPGASTNAGFTFNPTSGCGPTEVQINALIDGQGAPVGYAWDLGNGSLTSGPDPTGQYTIPGSYSIVLQTTIGGFVLNSVSIGGVNDNWCGDVEEISLFGACQGAPDIYFVLTDGQGGTFTSTSGDNSTTASWSGLNIPLSSPPYAIAFWDEDLISADDALGTYILPLNGSDTLPFNVAGGTFGELVVDLVDQQVFHDTDTFVLFAAPEPTIAYDTLGGTICVNDTNLAGVTWFHDGDTVITGTNACVQADGAGTWWAVVNNAFGCSTWTDTVVICPTISIVQNGDVLYTSTGLIDYQWTWNGAPIAGADGPFVIAEVGGVYAVSAINGDGCTLQAEYQLVMTSTLGRPVASPIMRVSPNPTDGLLRVVMEEPGSLQVLDAIGRVLITRRTVRSGQLVPLDLGQFVDGPYILRGATPSGVVRERVILAR